jgi:hypothetical protein
MVVWLTCGLAVAIWPAAAGAHRQQGAHEHGRGTLNIAIEGARVTMELEVPGFDIVGFEHAARTSQQKAAVDKAKAQLAAPLTLFVLPAAAGCKLAEATVALESGEQGEDNKAKAGARKAAGKDEHVHAEFRAQYALDCASSANLTAIEFAFFRVFAAAQKLDVNVITPKGQTKFEVSRGKPRISLAGMM